MKMRAKSFNDPSFELGNHPSNQSREDINVDVVKIGFFGLIFGVVINALIIYLSVVVLAWQKVVSFKLEWSACLALSAIYVVARAFDRVFFRQQ
jgi:hypothetical protein